MIQCFGVLEGCKCDACAEKCRTYAALNYDAWRIVELATASRESLTWEDEF